MTKPNVLFLMTDQQRWDAMSCSGGWGPHAGPRPHCSRRRALHASASPPRPSASPHASRSPPGAIPHNNAVWSNLQYTMPPRGADLDALPCATSATGLASSARTHLHPHRGDLRGARKTCCTALRPSTMCRRDRAAPRAQRPGHEPHDPRLWRDKGLLDAYRADFADRFANKPHVVRPSVLPLEDYADVYVGQQAKRYLEAYDGDEPWFCWVSFGGPHEPWGRTGTVTPACTPPETMPPPVPRAGGRPPTAPRGWLDYYMEHSTPTFDPGDEAAMRANYAGKRDANRRPESARSSPRSRNAGELGNTVIAFTSDHGEMNGDWGLIYKMNFLDGALRVPLLLRTPGDRCPPNPHARAT